MHALALSAPEKMELREIASPEVGPRQILIRSGAVGLCGTDFHIYQGHANYNTDDAGRLIPLRRAPTDSGSRVLRRGRRRRRRGERSETRRPRCRRSGNQLPEPGRGRTVRVLRDGQLPSVRAVQRTRHHRVAGRARRFRGRPGDQRRQDRERPAAGAGRADRAAGLRHTLLRDDDARFGPLHLRRRTTDPLGVDLRRRPRRTALHAIPAKRHRIRRAVDRLRAERHPPPARRRLRRDGG